MKRGKGWSARTAAPRLNRRDLRYVCCMGEQNKQESGLAVPKKAGRDTARRIGVHLSTSGGVWTAVDRAREAGANTLQIFSSSPRTWRPTSIAPKDAEKLKSLRAEHDIGPMAIHVSYLVNVCCQGDEVLQKSILGLRGEVERALALGAEYLVLHPGSFRGMTREQGMALAAESIARSIDGLPWQDAGLSILIENTCGAEFSLGGSFEQVGELVAVLKPVAPVAVCLDTCHTHVAGYDLISEEGYAETMRLIDQHIGFEAVRVWHCNDAKAARGSKLDRHQHIGEGTMGAEPFRRLLHDPRFAHAAFIAETPVDEPGDEARNVATLRALAAR